MLHQYYNYHLLKGFGKCNIIIKICKKAGAGEVDRIHKEAEKLNPTVLTINQLDVMIF